MEKDIILRPDDVFQLNLALTQILDNALCELALIINKSGRLITAQSETSDFDNVSIAALVTGSFASSGSIAQLIGEEEFESMYQEGKEAHVLVTQIDDSNILTTIFSNRTTLKKVKLAIEQGKSKLMPVLKSLYAVVENDPFLNLDVSNYDS
jgi:predicted regulator of Ras-like GTPase activity (Roadblock/LC7/MglB family)